jgi:hypothetical protein
MQEISGSGPVVLNVGFDPTNFVVAAAPIRRGGAKQKSHHGSIHMRGIMQNDAYGREETPEQEQEQEQTPEWKILGLMSPEKVFELLSEQKMTLLTEVQKDILMQYVAFEGRVSGIRLHTGDCHRGACIVMALRRAIDLISEEEQVN